LVFDDNLGSDFKHFYRGPQILVPEAQGPGPGPREFYNSDFPAGVTPYLYDPSQGNLLVDAIARQGWSPSPRGDLVPDIRTGLGGPPFATQGDERIGAVVHQFTFIPVTPGDYNRDATVDAADYVVWRKGLGTTYTQADYDVWRANFGRAPSAGWSIGSGAALPSAEPLPIAVPEPAAWVMLLTGMLATFSRRCDPLQCPVQRASG
jgi:hypothetical protein